MVTIKDISKKTGYAVTTVSRALNDHSDVNEDTRQIIKQAAKEMYYVPNLIAKNLVTQSSKTIGFITNKLVKGSLMDNFAIRVFLGMFEVKHPYEVILIHYDSDFFNSKSFDKLVSERQLEGAVIQGFDKDDPFIKQALDSKYPAILVDIGFENETTSYVGSDISQAFSLGIESIVNAGFQDVTIVVGKEASFVTTYWLTEINKYLASEHSEKITLLRGEYSEEQAYQVVKAEIQAGRVSEVYFCLSDIMAIGVYGALKEAGISIPEEVSVLGYDDIIVSKYLTPKLSSISQDWGNVGSTAVLKLIQLINHKSVTPELLDVEIKIRESYKEKRK